MSEEEAEEMGRADKIPRSVANMSGGVKCLGWSPDGEQLACGDNSSTLTVFDGSSFEVVWSSSHGSCVNCVGWSPDGEKLACGQGDYKVTGGGETMGDKENNTLTIFDVAKREVAWSRQLEGGVTSLRWSPDGSQLACGDYAMGTLTTHHLLP